MAGKLHWTYPVLRQHARSWRTPASRSPKRRLAKALGLLAGLGVSNGVAITHAQAQACGTALVSLDYRTRTTGEDWKNRASAGIPTVYSFTQAGTVYTSSDANSTFQVGTVNGATLAWSANYTSAANNTSTVTYTFSRAVSNLSIRVQDIDAVFNPGVAGLLSSGFTDEVTFTGNNGNAGVTPVLTRANAVTKYTAIANNVATGIVSGGNNTTTDDATVIATYSSPVTSITLQYRNVTGASTINNQSVGIDYISWCRVSPTANAVTTGTITSTSPQVGISSLNGSADGTPTYTLATVPAQGKVYYNSTGTTYVPAIDGQVLTAAQAASLRYTPNGAYTGTSTSLTYRVADDAGLTSNTAIYTIPLQYIATCGPNPGTTTLGFGSRTAGEDWKSQVAEGVPAGSTATLISSGSYASGAASTSVLQIGTANNAGTLLWNNQYSTGSTNTSSVTFTFTRPVSNFTVQIQDIDAGPNFTDQVVFQGANGGTAVTPILTAANPGAGIVTISGNVATGQVATSSTVDGTVTAYFASAITTLTLTYNNSSASTTPGNQLIGIDQMTWCRTLPTAVDVTSAALLNSIGTASISSLASLADNVPVTYTLTSIPSATTQGVLSFNSSGTTYTNIAAANQVLTAAQAASLRFTPVANSSGNVTFAYKATDALGNLSANTATYTIPVVSAPCTTATAELNFRTSTPVPDDWRAHAAVAVGGSLTTVSTSNYQPAAGATTNTFSVLAGNATNNINGVQTLAWVTDYANQANNTSSVTFTFSRPVSNYSMRVQDIDRSEVNGGAAFIDQVTFVGANGGTPVLPALTAVGTTNSVLINGNVATGTANVANVTDGTVVAYFASPITSLTLTYRNTSTFIADPTANGIGIELMNFCRLAPLAADVTNASRPSGQGATAINPLNATAPDGTITSYTITALPPASQGTYYVNGVALTASTLTPAQAAQLSFAPAAGFSGSASFSYTATDNANAVSNTATYTVPVTNTGAAGAPAPCASAGTDGSPTISENPNTYYPSTTTQSLAVGATSINVGVATVGGTTPTPTSIVKGDLLLVIQMQGADINATNTDAYGDGVAGGGASGNLQNANFTAGTYEYVVASNTTPITAAAGGTITLATPLVNSYVNAPATTTAGPRRFQVVRVPQYANLTLGGTLAATPWNGSIGGIIVLDVAGQTSFSGNTITAAGRGFRGGGGRTQGTTNYNSPDYVNVSNATTDLNAQKGEGTAGTPRYVNVPATVNDATTNATVDSGADGYPGGTTSRGAPGNAGGGGNDDLNNSGGGGGANGGFGGRGGNNFSGNKAIGGEPGASFGLASTSRLVLGGGGGAGSTNNATGSPGSGFASSGAAGGGIVMLRTGTISGTGTISANGGNANSSLADDGSGGGGAGGSILVTASSTASLSGLTLTANGGTGGTNTGGASGTHGPGGGGGGGVILTNGAVAATAVIAGNSGTTSGGVAFGATAGLGGISNTSVSNSIGGSVSGATCPADVATTITGPASASAGQPTGTFTVTFSNQGGGLATGVTQTVSLPTGAGLSAAQQTAIKNAYPSATFTTTGSGTSTNTTINFGTLATLAGGASTSYLFAYTAPATSGTVATISNANTSSVDINPANNTASVNTIIGAAADVTVALNGPTTLNAGQPTGNFTATFTNEGPSAATNVNRTVTLPAGATVTATQLAIIRATYSGATYSSTTNVLDFGTLASLASDASSTVTFAFTAPTALGSSTLTGSTSAATAEGSDSAPNQTTLALTTVATADVVAAITATSTAATGTFDVTFSNSGPQSAAGVVRTVQLPAGLTGVSVTGGGSYDPTSGLVTYSPSPTTITAGGSLTSAISYSLASGAAPVAATATVSTTTNEAGQTANNTFTALMPASFDLATTLTGPATTIAGSPTTLYLTTTNNGPNNAPTATQTVVIPSAGPLTNVYITNGGTYTYNTTTKEGTVTFPSVANLPVGQAITNSISFSAPGGSFAPSAVVTVNSGDTNTGNNTAYLNGSQASTQVAVTPATTNQSNETTTIVADKTIVSAGTVVTYTVTATNKGNLNNPLTTNVAEQVQLLPGLTTSTLTVGGVTGTTLGNLIQFGTGTTATTYDPATGVVTYPVLASQTSGTTFTFDKLAVTVPANTGNNGQLLATASVRTAQSDPTPADNTSSVAVKVQTAADLATTLTGTTTATAGQAASYTATFVNRGTGSATNVQQTVQLPAGLTGVLVQDASGNVVNNAYNVITGLVTIPTLASMASGTSQVYGISFVAPAQSFPLTSSVSSGTTDPSANNNSALLRTAVNPAADVAVYVSGPATAVAGNAITYAVTTANNGPSPASNVQASLQLPAGLTGVTITGGGAYDATSGLVTFPSVNLPAGDSRIGAVTFTMPTSPINGQLSGSASVTASSTDVVASNNTSAITTDVAPATSDMADLATSITASATSATAGSAISYTLNFRNTSTTTAATKVMPTAYLPAGLSNVVVTTLVNGATVVVPNAYNSATGQMVLPTIDSQAPGNLTQYTVSLTAPSNASAVAISASAVSSNTSDPNSANNVQGNSVNITPSYDAVTSLSGPLTAQPGSTNTYTVTTTNNGPSTAPNTLTQTVTLPAGVTALNITGNGTQSGNIITFPAISSQVAGANGAVANTFSIVMPATGSLPLTAAVTVGTANATAESNTGNNQATLTTAPANQAPVAQNAWNTLQSARGNTAASLLISPLNAIDPENSSLTYSVTMLPASSQGVLYLASGTAVAVGQPVPANGLYFVPSSNFVGNATFTYQATDNASATSNQALYTIPVAQDQSAAYTAYNSGKTTTAYTANDVLAQVVDANAAAYNGAGVIYNATSGLEQAGTSNGLASAVLSSGTLPAGTALRTSTTTDANGTIRPAGELYVTDPSLLPALTQATTYTVQVTVTDLNGGISTVPATFTLGASPLPVSLVAFTAQAVQNRDAWLSWTTASELSNARFEVERSFDGKSFAKVGEVAGQGTKATTTRYSFTDAGVGARAQGLVYYRLRQVDIAGTAVYSSVRTATFTKATTSLVTLYPNPAGTTTALDLSPLPATGTYQVLLLDVTGRQVLAATLAGGQPQPLDLRNLATGTYHVLVTGTQADGSPLRQMLRLTKE